MAGYLIHLRGTARGSKRQQVSAPRAAAAQLLTGDVVR
jgi:hypothetical protein